MTESTAELSDWNAIRDEVAELLKSLDCVDRIARGLSRARDIESGDLDLLDMQDRLLSWRARRILAAFKAVSPHLLPATPGGVSWQGTFARSYCELTAMLALKVWRLLHHGFLGFHDHLKKNPTETLVGAFRENLGPVLLIIAKQTDHWPRLRAAALAEISLHSRLAADFGTESGYVEYTTPPEEFYLSREQLAEMANPQWLLAPLSPKTSIGNVSNDANTCADATVRADDQKNSSSVKHPANPDVRDLCARLAKPRNGRSMNQIAIEFTRGDVTKAQSLLRKCRDYRHLWERNT